MLTLFFPLFLIPSSSKAFEYDNNKIYFFYQPSCPHCHKAINYIQTTYPDIDMELVNITEGARHHKMFVICAAKFRLGNQLGTPLFCMPDQYIMGWAEEEQKQLDDYIAKHFPDRVARKDVQSEAAAETASVVGTVPVE